MSESTDMPDLSLPRMLALVPYFAQPRTTTEAATDLDMPHGEVRAAVEFFRRLELPGVPGRQAFTVRTEGFEVQITPVADLLSHPLHLTAAEMSAMLLTLETLEASPMLRDPEVARSAARKLRTCGGGPSAVADTTPHDPADADRAAILATVRRAVDDNVVLEIDYRTASGRRSVRSVDPVQLIMVEDDPYLRAVERGDGAGESAAEADAAAPVKSFRIDRMLGAVATDRRAAWHGVPELDPANPHGFGDDADRWARVEVEAGSTWVGDYDPVFFVHDPGDADAPDGGPYPADVPATNARRTIGFLLRRWPGVKATEPVSLSKAVAERARAGLRAYGSA
ncbi:YafY family protein [uncultured Corynebacterium sp.]|uniref:helix-turn-helix transcriptional regulator n=1 Tax=uncultured Corynebacterium sp. TaxID=159447 RepID=UPI0025E405CE|nr:WYL domain-containing protein [uncultured Corynebacterium sp.]